MTRPGLETEPSLTCKSQLAYNFYMSDVFEAIANRARRAVLDELYERDGQALFELCGRLTMKHHLNMSRQAISQHLQVLEEAGLISTERKGRYKLHYLQTGPLQAIIDRWLGNNPKGDGR